MTIKEAAKRGKEMEVPRGRSYGIRATVLYRIRGEKTWREGMLSSFSISQVLFTTDKPLDEGTNIEMRFTLPIKLKGKRAADVSCRGYVVRSECGAAAKGAIEITAKLSHSRLIRQST